MCEEPETAVDGSVLVYLRADVSGMSDALSASYGGRQTCCSVHPKKLDTMAEVVGQTHLNFDK